MNGSAVAPGNGIDVVFSSDKRNENWLTLLGDGILTRLMQAGTLNSTIIVGFDALMKSSAQPALGLRQLVEPV